GGAGEAKRTLAATSDGAQSAGTRRGDLVMKSWIEANSASTDEILAWAETQPWARTMAECPQDAEWHAEGDVWTHTRMVVAEVQRLLEWPSLDRDAQLKLLFTALFHDAGKPGTTATDPAT